MIFTRDDVVNFTSAKSYEHDHKIRDLTTAINNELWKTTWTWEEPPSGQGRSVKNEYLDSVTPKLDSMRKLLDLEHRLKRVYHGAINDAAVNTPNEMIRIFPDVYLLFLEWKIATTLTNI